MWPLSLLRSLTRMRLPFFAMVEPYLMDQQYRRTRYQSNKPLMGIEPMTFPLPRECSTAELQRRTTVDRVGLEPTKAIAKGFTVPPLCRSGHRSRFQKRHSRFKPLVRLELTTF